MAIFFMIAIMVMGLCLNNFYHDFMDVFEVLAEHKVLFLRAALFLSSVIGLLLIAYFNLV